MLKMEIKLNVNAMTALDDYDSVEDITTKLNQAFKKYGLQAQGSDENSNGTYYFCGNKSDDFSNFMSAIKDLKQKPNVVNNCQKLVLTEYHYDDNNHVETIETDLLQNFKKPIKVFPTDAENEGKS